MSLTPVIATVVASASVLLGCGYHPLTAGAGPAAGHLIALETVEVSRALDSGLASGVARALPMELARAGVPLTRAHGEKPTARLYTLLAPVGERPIAFPRAPEGFEAPSTSGRVTGVFVLEARLRIRIVTEEGRALWEGSVVASTEYAESIDLADRAASRERAERDLAAALAIQVREVLVR